jgi:hypothetical protein
MKLKHLLQKNTHTHTLSICCYHKNPCLLASGVEYLHHNELFEIGKSTIHVVLWEFVFAINVVCKNQNTLA